MTLVTAISIKSHLVAFLNIANCAPLVAEFIPFFHERDFMMSPSDDKQADIIDAFKTTSRYLDDILNIDNVFFTIWFVKYTLQSSNFIKLIPLIPKPHF